MCFEFFFSRSLEISPQLSHDADGWQRHHQRSVSHPLQWLGLMLLSIRLAEPDDEPSLELLDSSGVTDSQWRQTPSDCRYVAFEGSNLLAVACRSQHALPCDASFFQSSHAGFLRSQDELLGIVLPGSERAAIAKQALDHCALLRSVVRSSSFETSTASLLGRSRGTSCRHLPEAAGMPSLAAIETLIVTTITSLRAGPTEWRSDFMDRGFFELGLESDDVVALLENLSKNPFFVNHGLQLDAIFSAPTPSSLARYLVEQVRDRRRGNTTARDRGQLRHETLRATPISLAINDHSSWNMPATI